MMSFAYHKYKNELIVFLFLVGIFIDFKIDQYFIFFNIKFTYFFLIIIFSIYFVSFKIIDSKNIFFFFFFLLLIFNFSINFNTIQTQNFLKQTLAIFFFVFIFFNFFNSSEKFFNNFLKQYLNFSIIFCCIGLVIYFLIIIFDTKLFYYFLNKQAYVLYLPHIFDPYENFNLLKKIYLLSNNFMNKEFLLLNNYIYRLFQIYEPVRFQGLFSEPASAGIILLPALCIVLNKKRFVLSHFCIIFFSIVLTQSLYAYLGLFIILLINIKNNFKKISFIFFSIILIYFNPIMINKVIDSTNHFQSILNLEVPRNIYKKKFYKTFDKMTYEEMNQYVKKYITKDADQTRLEKIDHIYKKNKYRKNLKISNDDLDDLLKLNILVTVTYINASSCSYLYNTFVTFQSLKNNIFFGNGLGSYGQSYTKYSDSWKYKPYVYSNCYKLNHLDAKTLFLRILSEFGLIFFVILALYFIFIIKDLIFIKDKFIYIWFLSFNLKILQLGSYTDMTSYLLLTIALKLYYLKKNNVTFF